MREVDNTLLKIKRKYSITEAIKPINEKEEKRKFFTIKNYEPSFNYEKISLPSREEIEKLKEHVKNISHKYVKKLYKDTPSCIEKEIKMLNSIGTDEFVKLSRKIYGKPSLKYVKIAEEFADLEVKEKEYQKAISGKTLKEIFEDMLNTYYSLNWKIIFSSQYPTSVIPEKKTIKLNKERMFSIEEVQRLVNHEIKVHVLRSVNGYMQNYKILGIGLPKYLKTEEGLAVYMEVQQEIADSFALKLRALRLLAVRMMLKSFSFKEIFNFLESKGLKKEVAWSTTLRVFRGGGFTKDYVYFEGYYEINKYLSQDKTNKMKTLYIGKIGLKDIKLIQKMIKHNILNHPSYLPEELEEKEI